MEIDINFDTIDVSLPEFIDIPKFQRWLIAIAGKRDKQIQFLNYIFCSDDHLLSINQQYLDHDYYTDIITFPYKQDDLIEADIFISVDRVKENASDYDVSYDHEMKRVMSHGLLHLLGYSDKDEVASQEMRNAEDEAISLFER